METAGINAILVQIDDTNSLLLKRFAAQGEAASLHTWDDHASHRTRSP